MIRIPLTITAFLLLAACASTRGGMVVRTLSPEQAGMVRCLGIENYEIIKIARNVNQDIQINFLQKNPTLIRENKPIRIVIDSRYWTNESAQNLNLNIIADQLSVQLQRNANNKMAFLSRDDFEAIEHERALKRKGAVDKGALGLVDKIAGADYRMGARLTAQNTSSSSGMKQIATSLALWLIDLETGSKVWSWIKNITKEGSGSVC